MSESVGTDCDIDVRNALPFATALLGDLRALTLDGDGVSRESFGHGEQVALDLLAGMARELALDVSTDVAGNLHMTLPGQDRSLPAWITGSHVDSVPQGGNYDGAAGVVAGLTAIRAFRQASRVPRRTVTVIGIRGEEASSWYHGNHGGHLGSRAALGRLTDAELAGAVSVSTGKTLECTLRDQGVDTDAIAAGTPALAASRYRGFLELHIEQGPVLENRQMPVGIVTGIRGSARARNARCIGEYTHSGAVPHEYRSDAVLATVELCHRLDRAWDAERARGGDLVYTVGKLFTNPERHSLTKVPGETSFVIDFRSEAIETLNDMVATAHQLAAEIAARRRVRFELGKFNLSAPSTMDPGLRQLLSQGAACLRIPAIPIASGAGHDAQEFERAGFPSAMIFVRNSHGSHNPREAMNMDDFLHGTQLLAWALLQ